MQDKSANQLYRESKSSLPFKEWIEREKNKGKFIKNQLLKDVTGQEDDPQPEVAKASFDLGIPKTVLIAGIVVIVGAVLYNRYKK